MNNKLRAASAAVLTLMLAIGGGTSTFAAEVTPTIPEYDFVGAGSVGPAVVTLVALVIALSAIVFGAIVFKYGFRATWNALKSSLGIASTATRAGGS